MDIDKIPVREAVRKTPISAHLPFLGVIVLVSLGLRILPHYGTTFTPDGPIVRDPDATYHLRRIELTLNNFPELPLFDSYINHPEGAYVIWPPLYDLVLAALWALVDLLPGSASPLTVLVFLPPLFMTLACGVMYRTGLRLWPGKKWLASAAALVPAVLPATLGYSYLG